MPLKPRTPKEKEERPFRHGCVQAGHARIRSLRREPLIRARSVRRAKGPAYSKYLVQARRPILGGKHRSRAADIDPNVDPLFDRAVRRVHWRLTLILLPIELAVAVGGFFLVYHPSRQLLMALFLAFPLFALVRVLIRHIVRSLLAPTDVLVRREYERLARDADARQRLLPRVVENPDFRR